MSANDAKWARLWAEAHDAGMSAGEANVPVPIVIAGYAPIDDGLCGFAWITVRPGTTSFARWLAKHKKASRGYYGGMELWVHQFDQSYEKKLAYAQAFAETLVMSGVKATHGGRLD